MKTISTKQILKTAWEHTKTHFWFLWGLFAIIGVVTIVLSISLDAYEENAIAVIVLMIAQMLIGIIFQIGVCRILLNLSVGRTVEYGQLIGNSQYLVRFFLATLLYSLIVTVGTLLLLIPGIIWSLKYSQWPYLMVEKNMGVLESLKKSGEITYGAKMDMFVLMLALAGIMLISVIPLGLGLIVTIPLSTLVPVFVYRELTREHVSSVAETEHGVSEDAVKEQTSYTPA